MDSNLTWLVGALVGLAGGMVTLDRALEIITKYVKKAKAPDDKQNNRLDKIEARLKSLEEGQAKHAGTLERDYQRFEEMSKTMLINIKANRALLQAHLSGDNVEACQASLKEIDAYLYERSTSWNQ